MQMYCFVIVIYCYINYLININNNIVIIFYDSYYCHYHGKTWAESQTGRQTSRLAEKKREREKKRDISNLLLASTFPTLSFLSLTFFLVFSFSCVILPVTFLLGDNFEVAVSSLPVV